MHREANVDHYVYVLLLEFPQSVWPSAFTRAVTQLLLVNTIALVFFCCLCKVHVKFNEKHET